MKKIKLILFLLLSLIVFKMQSQSNFKLDSIAECLSNREYQKAKSLCLSFLENSKTLNDD